MHLTRPDRRWLPTFCRATRSAAGETSPSVTRASFTRRAMARPMQPEPVHRSRMRGFCSRNSAFLMASSVTAMVSSRGIEHVGRDGERHAVESHSPEDVGQWAPLPRGARTIRTAPAHRSPQRRRGRGPQISCSAVLPEAAQTQLPRDVRGKLRSSAGAAGRWRASRYRSAILSLPPVRRPPFPGRTSVSASMPTSSMESSGSFVVRYCSHMPGADSARVSQLSWRPTRRLNS